jgi:hypothetical protein
MFKALNRTHVKCVECFSFEKEQKCKRNKLFPPAFYRSLCFLFPNSEQIKLETRNWSLSIFLESSAKLNVFLTHSVCLVTCLFPSELVPFYFCSILNLFPFKLMQEE